MVLAGQVERARDAAQRAVDGRRASGERPGAVLRDYRPWRWWPSPTGSSTGRVLPRAAGGPVAAAQRGRVGQPRRLWHGTGPRRRRPPRRGRGGVAGRPVAKPSRPATWPVFLSTTGPSPTCASPPATGTTPSPRPRRDWPHRGERHRGRRRLRQRHLCARRVPPRRARHGAGGGGRGPAQSGGRPARDRLRVDDLDRSVAGRVARGARLRPCRAWSQVWDLIAPVRYLQAASRAMGPDLVRMAVAAGDRQRAVAVTEELERSAPRSGRRPPGGSRCAAAVCSTTIPMFCSKPSPPTAAGPGPTSWQRLVRTPVSPSGASARPTKPCRC